MLYPNRSTIRPHVSSPFGPRTGGAFSFHYGADLIGFTTVHAVAAGKVTFAGWMNSSAGYTVAVDHGGGVTSVYMHNAAHHVRRGDHVDEGEPLAAMGSSGNATGKCCHLEIRVHGTSIEPLAYIAARLQRPASITNPAPAVVPEEEEDDMAAMKGATYTRAKDKATVCILFNEASGFYVEHSGVDGKYNNPLAQHWGTGSWPTITEAHAVVIKRSLDAVRSTQVTGSLSVDIEDGTPA